MKVGLLGSKNMDFSIVRYHRDKLDYETGELMTIQNFPKFIMESKDPAEIRTYLMEVSQRSRSKKPQFHVSLSSFQQTYSKEELTAVARQLMTEHGYGKQPYVVIFHRDTQHNHVHIVSTRISVETGHKLKDYYELLTLHESLVKALKSAQGIDLKARANELLNYHYGSIADLDILLSLNKFKLQYSKRNEDYMVRYGLGTLVRRREEEIFFTKQLSFSRMQEIEDLFEREKLHASNLVFGTIKRKRSSAYIRDVVYKKGAKNTFIRFRSELMYRMKSLHQLDFILNMNHKTKNLEGTLIDHKTSSVFGPEYTERLLQYFKWTNNFIEFNMFLSLNAYNIESELDKKLLLHLNSDSDLKEYMLFTTLDKPIASVRENAQKEVLGYIHNPLQTGVQILKFPDDNKHYAFHERLHYVEALETLVEPKFVQKYLEMENKLGSQIESSKQDLEKSAPAIGIERDSQPEHQRANQSEYELETIAKKESGENGLVDILQDMLVPTLVGNRENEEQKRKRKKRSV